MRLLNLLLLLVLGLAAILPACSPADSTALTAEGRSTAAGARYTVFHPGRLAIRVVTRRPRPDDPACQLSVAAAYTDLTTNRPLDLLVCQGQRLQPRATVGFLDGQLTIVGDTLRIRPLPKGTTPPEAELARAQRPGGTVLLQELLVYQGRNLRPAGGSRFQRRALAEWSDHRWAVVESAATNLTMQQFAADLLELGARNALYLDMGDWDEGWYRAAGRVVTLGTLRTETARQSNWLIYTNARQ